MAATLDQLREYVRADARDEAFVKDCHASAVELVKNRIGAASVPPEVVTSAVLEVGANLFNRRLNRQGQPSFTDPEMMASPHRPALDPLTPAWPLLRPYLGPGIG